MAQDHEKLEEQRDTFTFVATLLFICLFIGLSNGYFELAMRKSGGSNGVFRALSLYVVPGLLCGFAWRKLGILLGAIVGAVVLLFSVVNLGFVIPYVRGGTQFSLEAATSEVSPVFLMVLLSAGAGAIAGLLGHVMVSSSLSARLWYRWLRRLARGLVTIGFVAAGGMALATFVPWGGARYARLKLNRLVNWMGVANTPLAIVIWVGLALTALCALAALTGLRASAAPGQEENE